MRNLFLTVAYVASMIAAFVACTPAEQQQTAQGAREAAEATHAVATICMAIAGGFPEVEAQCKNVHDATELVLKNLPTACAVPDAGGQ